MGTSASYAIPGNFSYMLRGSCLRGRVAETRCKKLEEELEKVKGRHSTLKVKLAAAQVPKLV